MRFSLDDEQQVLRQLMRRALEDLGPPGANDGDGSSWRRLAKGQGLIGLGTPTGLGGQGAGRLEVMLLMHECGRALATDPFLATVGLALPVLLELGGEELLSRVVPAMVEGDAIATLAGGLAGRGDAVVEPTSDGHAVVTGRCTAVPNADRASHVVVVDPGGGDRPSRVALVAAAAAAVHVPQGGIDLGRAFGTVTFEASSADLVWEGGAERLDQALDTCRVLAAAELVGVAERSLELAVGHAGQRYQFGRPIGSFQAVKHRCADIFVEVELARAAVEHAAWALDAAPERVHMAAPTAVSAAITAALFATQESLHVHGGLGFTWEHVIHRYLRRARATSTLLGGADAALRRVIERSEWGS